MCFIVDPYSYYTEEDILPKATGSTNWKIWKDGKGPVCGSILHFEGKYYVCTDPGNGFVLSPVKEPSRWYDITYYIETTSE